MPLTFHILAGAAAFHLTQNPTWGFIFAFLSHYLLDALPQQDYQIKNIEKGRWRNSPRDFLKVFADLSFGFLLVFLMKGYIVPIFIAGMLGILPDGLSLLYYIFPTNKLLAKHRKFHGLINFVGESKKIPVFLRVASQITIGIIAIYFLR